MDWKLDENRKQRVGLNRQFSKWRCVISRITQRSILGPVFCNLFINVMDLGMNNKVARFVDDTKLFRVVKAKNVCEDLQKDLSKVVEWALQWQMSFIISIRWCLQGQKNNLIFSYTLVGPNLAVTDQERDHAHEHTREAALHWIKPIVHQGQYCLLKQDALCGLEMMSFT